MFGGTEVGDCTCKLVLLSFGLTWRDSEWAEGFLGLRRVPSCCEAETDCCSAASSAFLFGHHGQKSRQRLPAARSHYGHLLRAMCLRGVRRVPAQVASASVLARPVRPIIATDGKELTVAMHQGPSNALPSWTRRWVVIGIFGVRFIFSLLGSPVSAAPTPRSGSSSTGPSSFSLSRGSQVQELPKGYGISGTWFLECRSTKAKTS